MRHRNGERNLHGGDRAILDRGYGLARRGDRWLPDRWLGIPVSGPPAATSYSLTGPSSGNVGVVSGAFNVDLIPAGSGGSVTITPNDGGAGGTFTPSSVTLP